MAWSISVCCYYKFLFNFNPTGRSRLSKSGMRSKMSLMLATSTTSTTSTTSKMSPKRRRRKPMWMKLAPRKSFPSIATPSIASSLRCARSSTKYLLRSSVQRVSRCRSPSWDSNKKQHVRRKARTRQSAFAEWVGYHKSRQRQEASRRYWMWCWMLLFVDWCVAGV